MNVTYINPVLNSIVNVLSMMAQTTPEAGKPAIKEDDKARGVVSGIISMNGESNKGEQASGSLALTFSKPAILDIYKKMMHEDKDEVDDMVKDLVGELSNMVLGGAKGILESEGHHFGLSLPEVLAGEDHVITHAVDGTKVILPFTTDAGEFYVEICFTD